MRCVGWDEWVSVGIVYGIWYRVKELFVLISPPRTAGNWQKSCAHARPCLPRSMCRQPVPRPPPSVAALGANNVVHGPRQRRAPVRPCPFLLLYSLLCSHPAPCPVLCWASTLPRAPTLHCSSSSSLPRAAQATWPPPGASRPAVRSTHPGLTGAGSGGEGAPCHRSSASAFPATLSRLRVVRNVH